MGENTVISWTDHTWNPWTGCRKVSAGCKNCYMFREQQRYGNDPNVVRRTAPATFNAPLHWTEPGLVFTCSWSDFFIEEADDWRNEAWTIMENTQHLTYQVLTKRIDRVRMHTPATFYPNERPWPKNVWLGVTAENQDELESRWPVLEWLGRLYNIQNIFLSLEPLLGPINLEIAYSWQDGEHSTRSVDWVICGGESGPGARPMNLEWARSIRDQCARQEIPYFFKQVGGSRKIAGAWGGDLLDGEQYHEFPETKVTPEQLSLF